ncbi:MAG: circadian clock protein KaiB [Candidatus Hydrogenedentes bacterium]|nr:circadian clock protein KaiB [Candidatus Hydrogenedentota bacterium]
MQNSANGQNTTGGVEYHFRLYVAGNSPNSARARENLKRICEAKYRDARIETIDVTEDPRRCLEDGVLVTPTLVRVLPRPCKRIIGDLSDRESVAGLLAG